MLYAMLPWILPHKSYFLCLLFSSKLENHQWNQKGNIRVGVKGKEIF